LLSSQGDQAPCKQALSSPLVVLLKSRKGFVRLNSSQPENLVSSPLLLPPQDSDGDDFSALLTDNITFDFRMHIDYFRTRHPG